LKDIHTNGALAPAMLVPSSVAGIAL
jgi:hypothetical protein